MQDDREDVSLTEQDLRDLEEAEAIVLHAFGTPDEQGDADRVGKSVTTLLAVANRIAVKRGFEDGSAGVERSAGAIKVRARRARPSAS